MRLEKLYEITERENIPVIPFKMQNKAIIGKINKRYCIGLNYSKIDSSVEEKELLAEELGHYYYDAFYDTSANSATISQKEYRANKWKCTILISINDFKEAFQKGLNTLHEIADYFSLSENTVTFAYNYYKENQYI